MTPRRVGVYGGTFNPPHWGHVRAAEAFYDAVRPERLLIIPSCMPPHKTVTDGVCAADRLAMARLAFSHIEHTEVSDMEILRGGKSYTAHTLSLLCTENTQLYFLVGTDMFLSMDTWYDPPTIFRLAEICYIRRESDAQTAKRLLEKEDEYRRRFGARLRHIDVPPFVVSSSDIRQGTADEAALPESVRRYIKERGLYRHDVDGKGL